MPAAGVVAQRDGDTIGVVLLDQALGCIRIVLAIIPDILIIVIDDEREHAGRRLSRPLKQRIDNVLTVDGQANRATQIDVFHRRIIHVHDKVVDRRLSTVERLLFRRDGIAVIRDAIG